MGKNSQAGCETAACSWRAAIAGILLATLAVVGGMQVSTQVVRLGPVEHVLSNRPPVTPTVTFDAPDFALLVRSLVASAPAVSHGRVLHAIPSLRPWLGEFSQYIRPPPVL